MGRAKTFCLSSHTAGVQQHSFQGPQLKLMTVVCALPDQSSLKLAAVLPASIRPQQPVSTVACNKHAPGSTTQKH